MRICFPKSKISKTDLERFKKKLLRRSIMNVPDRYTAIKTYCRITSTLIKTANALKANKNHIADQLAKKEIIDRRIRKYNYHLACNEEEIVENIGRLQRLYNNNKNIFNDSQKEEMARWIKIEEEVQEPSSPDDLRNPPPTPIA